MVFGLPDASDFKRIGNVSQALSILLTGQSQNRHHLRSLAETFYFRCDDMDCSGEVDCETNQANFQTFAALRDLYNDPHIEISWQASEVPNDQYTTQFNRITYDRVNDVAECKDIIVTDIKRIQEEGGSTCTGNTKAAIQACVEFKVKSEGFFNRETSYDFRVSLQQVVELSCEKGDFKETIPRTVSVTAFFGREDDKETCPQAGAIVMIVVIILLVFIGIGVGVFCSCRKKKQDVKPAA